MNDSATPHPAPTISVLVADVDANRRLAVIAMLARGIDVAEARNAYGALRLARERRPDVILLAAALPGLTTAQTLGRLKRHPETRGIAVIVTCPDDWSFADLQPHLTPGVREVLLLPTTPVLLHGKLNDALVQVRGDAADGRPLVNLGRRFTGATAGQTIDTADGPTTATVVSPNPILVRRAVQCPVCAHRSRLFRYDVRPGTLEVRRDRFDVPHYVGPRGGKGPYCNAHLVHVTVCPSCFFATGNADLFLLTEEDHPDHVPLPERTRQALLHDADRRGQHMWTFREAFFTEQRNVRETLTAFELARMSARVMHNCDPQHLPGELARIAQYHLRGAQLALWEVWQRPVPFDIDESRPLPPPAREQVAAAFTPLLEACGVLSGSALDQALYQLVAVSRELEDATTADHALTALRHRAERLGDDGPDYAGCRDYLARAEALLTDDRAAGPAAA